MQTATLGVAGCCPEPLSIYLCDTPPLVLTSRRFRSRQYATNRVNTLAVAPAPETVTALNETVVALCGEYSAAARCR